MILVDSLFDEHLNDEEDDSFHLSTKRNPLISD